MRIDRQITRGLRFRLTAGYALFFFFLLGGVAAMFQARLSRVLDDQAHNLVNQQWAAMKGYRGSRRTHRPSGITMRTMTMRAAPH